MTPQSARRLWRLNASLLAAWFSQKASIVVLMWLAFGVSESVAIVGIVFAVRLLPLALGGLPLGALADRYGRTAMLTASNFTGLVSMGAFAVVIVAVSPIGIVHLVIVAMMLGLSDAGRLVAAQGIAYEIAPSNATTRSIAVTNLTAGVGGTIGGFSGGLLLSAFGPGAAAGIAALVYGVAITPLIHFAEVSPRSDAPRTIWTFGDGLGLLRTNRSVAVFISIALVVEVLAFAGISLDSVFASDVFEEGATGLGAIVAARGVGRLLGAGGLSAVRHDGVPRLALSTAVLVFGMSLVGYALARDFALALALIGVSGAAAVTVDSLMQSALQGAVGNHERGRVAGLWVLAVGLEPVGVLGIALVADSFGPRFAQALTGGVVAVFGLGLVLGPWVIGRHLPRDRKS